MRTVFFHTLVYSIVSSQDLIEYHIRRFLDHNYSPCDNFFGYVCPSWIGNDSLSAITENIFDELENASDPLPQTVIDTDIAAAAESNLTFTIDSYSRDVQNRCGSDRDCYEADYRYIYNVYSQFLPVTTLLVGFSESIVSTATPDEISRIAVQLVDGIERKLSIEDSSSYYRQLRKRLRIMNHIESDSTFLQTLVSEAHQLAVELAVQFSRQLQSYTWLREGGEFQLPTLFRFDTILNNITLKTDFDPGFDLNATARNDIEQFLVDEYTNARNITLGAPEVTLKFALLSATISLTQMLISAGREDIAIRIDRTFRFVAENTADSVVLMAPTFYPLMNSTNIAFKYGSLGSMIGSKLAYRFVDQKDAGVSQVFNSTYESLSERFQNAAHAFSVAVNLSTAEVLRSYIADLEGIQLAYECFSSDNDEAQRSEMPYEDLPFTNEQLFFVAYAVMHCRDTEELQEQPESSVLRVNGVVGQMEDFARAFECQPGDTMTSF